MSNLIVTLSSRARVLMRLHKALNKLGMVPPPNAAYPLKLMNNDNLESE